MHEEAGEQLALAEENGRVLERLSRAGMAVQAPMVAAQLLVLELFAVTGAQIPFIYFQF